MSIARRIMLGVLVAAGAAFLAGEIAPTEAAGQPAAKAKAKNKVRAKNKNKNNAVQAVADEPAAKPEAKPEDKPADKPVRVVARPMNPKAIARMIDQAIDKKLAEAKVTPSGRCSDAEFLRRAYLDLTGVIPPADKAAAFLDSTDPDKRAKLIDELLESKNYGRHQSDIWINLLYPKDSDVRRLNKGPLVTWLTDRFNENKPWDTLVYDLVTASGEQDKNPAVTYFLANRTVDKMTDNVTRSFLGVQLQCAQCHNHPFTAWKQNEYWGMAAFFMRVQATQPRAMQQNQTLSVTEGRFVRRGRNFLPESAKIVPAKFIGGEQPKTSSADPLRPVLAKWLTAPENPYFAKAIVNRTWGQLFGRGFVNPVDDMIEEHEPSHPELLNALAKDFAAGGFDLKQFIRGICLSNAYQRSAKPEGNNAADKELFSHMALKVLTPEMLFDSLGAVVGNPAGPPGRFGGGAGPRGPFNPRDRFAAFFAGSEGAKPTDYEAGIPQALRLMNARNLSSSPTLVRELARKNTSPDQVIEKLYLTTVSRRPTPEETKKMTAYVAKQSDAQAAYGDILWALLNSSEFTLNR